MTERTKDAFAALVSTIRAASQVASQDIPFYKSLDNDLSSSADDCSERLLDIANSIIQTVVQDKNEIEELDSLESLNQNWNGVSSVLDTLFDKTDLALEDKIGEQHAQTGPEKQQELQKLGGDEDRKVQKHSRGTEKPQDKFTRPINNSMDEPFKPLLTSKPHALEPFEKSMIIVQDEEDSTEDGLERPHYKQPYEYEIMNQSYPKMKQKDPIKYHDWEKTTHILVDTEEKLQSMLKALKKSKEIAVDLEHHDYRSFYGFVCLMQISNRDQDWIVDTLKLREELDVLNQVFANPKIVKVFHGSFMDITWLQRDFGLYVVSLFDTYYAARALGLKRHGLAHLLETYAKFQTSKKYQLADWRIRPLPQEMLLYARSDTHFLLYIFDVLRNELLQQNKLDHVLKQSREVAAKRYETPGYAVPEKGYDNILGKYSMNGTQQILLKELYDWRDRAARLYDESPRYIMPNHFLAALCYTQPTNVNSVLGVSNGLTSHIRNSAKEIARIIQKFKDSAANTIVDESTAETAGEQEDKDAKIEVNYEGYEREYKKAVKSQKKLLKLSSEKLDNDSMYGQMLDGERESDLDELEQRQLLLDDQLELKVPLPTAVDSEDEAVENEEVEQEVEQMQEAESPVEETNDSESPKRKHPENEGQKRKKRKTIKVLDSKSTANLTTRDEENMDRSSDDEPHVKPHSEEAKTFAAVDYSSSQSVLKSSDRKKQKQPKKNKKEQFNPHRFEDEGPQGVKRRRGPQGGRTITFKNKK